MADASKISDVDAISSPDHSESDLPPKKVTLASDHQDASDEKRHGPQRKDSVYSSSGRRVSEWEALQIVAAGDLETIDREIDEIEASLQQMSIQSTWYKPQLRLKDPRYFTWLLVSKFSLACFQRRVCTDSRAGFASMGGLLSGIDQSLISGANLYMPACKTSPHMP
jgi:hypothetical protein